MTLELWVLRGGCKVCDRHSSVRSGRQGKVRGRAAVPGQPSVRELQGDFSQPCLFDSKRSAKRSKTLFSDN